MPNNLPAWAELFPTGRVIYYEGDDPEGFARQIREEFGFDPTTATTEPYDYPYGWNEEHGWSFLCPSEHLDAIYGSCRFPMGS